MSTITNQPKKTDDEVTNKLRAAIGHRAMWMGLILKEIKERGLDWEAIGHSAIHHTGCIHGEVIKGKLSEPDSMVEFGNTFLNEDVRKIFEMDIKRLDNDALVSEFGYCPLLAGWQQAGIQDPEMLDKLCDVAMSGDRGIGSRFEKYEFKLGKTIAQGNKVCEVAFYRKAK